MHTIVPYNQQIIDTSTDILCITSAYKWTNTGYLNRFRCVFCFCLSSCSHTGSFYSVQLFVVFFFFCSFGVPVFLLDVCAVYAGFFSSAPVLISFFCFFFRASVLILEVWIVFSCFLQSRCSQAVCLYRFQMVDSEMWPDENYRQIVTDKPYHIMLFRVRFETTL